MNCLPGANDQKLGDTAQSMTLHNGTLWIVVNTSNVIFAIDPYTFQEKGRITGLASPRYIHFVSDDKAYVSQMEDINGNLWVLTDGGGWEENPIGFESPRLSRIDPEKLSIEKSFTFTGDYTPLKLTTDRDGNNLFFLGSGVWKMSANAGSLPEKPLVSGLGYGISALGISPYDSDIYVADAIDWQQNGSVTRYSADGKVKDEFKVGIIPGAFCWY